MTERIHVEKEGLAERGSAQHPELADVALRHVERIAIIGAGTMGTGIAIAALDAGFHVLLLECGLARFAIRSRLRAGQSGFSLGR